MYNITERQFQIYIKECKKWVKIFGLYDWECFYECKADHGTRASIDTSPEAGICTFCLNSEWDGRPTRYLIQKTAFHEVMELFLMRMRHLTYSRFSTPNEIDTENHRILRTLENVVFNPLYPGKETEEQKGIVDREF